MLGVQSPYRVVVEESGYVCSMGNRHGGEERVTLTARVRGGECDDRGHEIFPIRDEFPPTAKIEVFVAKIYDVQRKTGEWGCRVMIAAKGKP